MSLNGALQIGRSALVASQTAMQVAGNNMANAATEGYHRRSVHLTPSRDELAVRNAFVGTGVSLLQIRREFDSALQSRFRDASSREQGSLIDQRFLTQIESLQNELTGNDVSSALSEFFNAFSELANTPDDQAIRALVIEQGRSLAGRIANLRAEYTNVMDAVDRSLSTSVTEADRLLDDIADINIRITQVEKGEAQANALRDERDQLVDQLSEYLEVSTIEQANGAVDVFVGSIPVVLAGVSRGIELRTKSVDGVLEQSIRVSADGTTLSVNSGRIGGLMRQREETVQPAIDDLNGFAAQLIFQVNKVHSQGQGRVGHAAITGTYGVNDSTANLNSLAAGLPFSIANGSFFIHVTHVASGQRSTYQIGVDGNADSLDDLINRINVTVGVPNVTAATGLNNVLTLTADGGHQMSFSDDTSGALAALGVNTFFTGEVASDIDVNAAVSGNLSLLAAGSGHVPGSNGTAVALAELQDVPLADLGDRSIRDFWHDKVNTLAVATTAANDAAETTRLVSESLTAQIAAVSGVSIDEESINLLTFQRQFQAAARFISVIDEAIQTLLAMAT